LRRSTRLSRRQHHWHILFPIRKPPAQRRVNAHARRLPDFIASTAPPRISGRSNRCSEDHTAIRSFEPSELQYGFVRRLVDDQYHSIPYGWIHVSVHIAVLTIYEDQRHDLDVGGNIFLVLMKYWAGMILGFELPCSVMVGNSSVHMEPASVVKTAKLQSLVRMTRQLPNIDCSTN
jgi:hypothetical protein